MPKDIRYLKGVGEKRAELFAKKGIKTVEDLLYYFPRSHEDRTEKKDIADWMNLMRLVIDGRNGVREHYRFFACQRNKSKAEYAYFNNDCIGRIGCFECGLVQ